MTSVFLAEPGSEYGPCVDPCGHSDCRATRETAAWVCSYCNEPIGYGRHFYSDDPEGWIHAVCLEQQIEEEQS